MCDKRARMLTDQQRSGVAEYLSVVSGSDKGGKAVRLRHPLHPSLQRAYVTLEQIFEDDIIQDHGQELLSNPDYWGKILNMVPDIRDLREKLRDNWEKCVTAKSRWHLLKKVVAKMARSKDFTFDQQKDLEGCVVEIVFTCTYPRLDVAVSTHRNHLLKSPFCVHPKTGRVCVPFEASKCEDFDPFKVPTLGSLAEEMNAFDEEFPNKKSLPAVQKTCMKDYLALWTRVFLKPLYSEINADFRSLREEHAVSTGDFM